MKTLVLLMLSLSCACAAPHAPMDAPLRVEVRVPERGLLQQLDWAIGGTQRLEVGEDIRGAITELGLISDPTPWIDYDRDASLKEALRSLRRWLKANPAWVIHVTDLWEDTMPNPSNEDVPLKALKIRYHLLPVAQTEWGE